MLIYDIKENIISDSQLDTHVLNLWKDPYYVTTWITECGP